MPKSELYKRIQQVYRTCNEIGLWSYLDWNDERKHIPDYQLAYNIRKSKMWIKENAGKPYSSIFMEKSTQWIFEAHEKLRQRVLTKNPDSRMLPLRSCSSIRKQSSLALFRFQNYCHDLAIDPDNGYDEKELYLTSGTGKYLDLVIDIDWDKEKHGLNTDAEEHARYIFDSVLHLPMRYIQPSRGSYGRHPRILLTKPTDKSPLQIHQILLLAKKKLKEANTGYLSNVCSILGDETGYDYGCLPVIRGGLAFAPKLDSVTRCDQFEDYLAHPVPFDEFMRILGLQWDNDVSSCEETKQENIEQCISSLCLSLQDKQRCVDIIDFDVPATQENIENIAKLERGIQRKTALYFYLARKLNRQIQPQELLEAYEKHNLHNGKVWGGRHRECQRVCNKFNPTFIPLKCNVYKFLEQIEQDYTQEDLAKVGYRRKLQHKHLAWGLELIHNNLHKKANSTCGRNFIRKAARIDYEAGKIDFRVDYALAAAIIAGLIQGQKIAITKGPRSGRATSFCLGPKFRQYGDTMNSLNMQPWEERRSRVINALMKVLPEKVYMPALQAYVNCEQRNLSGTPENGCCGFNLPNDWYITFSIKMDKICEIETWDKSGPPDQTNIPTWIFTNI